MCHSSEYVIAGRAAEYGGNFRGKTALLGNFSWRAEEQEIWESDPGKGKLKIFPEQEFLNKITVIRN